MANKNTRRMRAEKAKDLAAKKKLNRDYRQPPTKRLGRPKNMDVYKHFPNFRKTDKVAA